MKSLISQFRNDWALVTGASSGLGKEFAVQLAEAGLNLILMARRESHLRDLSQSLSAQYGIRCLFYSIDLKEKNAAFELKNKVEAEKIKVRLLVNNAAFGTWGYFKEDEASLIQDMIQVNVAAPVVLMRVFLDHLQSFSPGGVINVASAAMYQPVPFMAVYSATKSFLGSVSQAVYGEENQNLVVQTLVPGPIQTEFESKFRFQNLRVGKRDSPQTVVKKSLAEFSPGRPLCVAARGTFLQKFLAFLPPNFALQKVAQMFRPGQEGE